MQKIRYVLCCHVKGALFSKAQEGFSNELIYELGCILDPRVQALLQMQDVTTAVNALQFYTNVQPSIRYVFSLYY